MQNLYDFISRCDSCTSDLRPDLFFFFLFLFFFSTHNVGQEIPTLIIMLIIEITFYFYNIIFVPIKTVKSYQIKDISFLFPNFENPHRIQLFLLF